MKLQENSFGMFQQNFLKLFIKKIKQDLTRMTNLLGILFAGLFFSEMKLCDSFGD